MVTSSPKLYFTKDLNFLRWSSYFCWQSESKNTNIKYLLCTPPPSPPKKYTMSWSHGSETVPCQVCQAFHIALTIDYKTFFRHFYNSTRRAQLWFEILRGSVPKRQGGPGYRRRFYHFLLIFSCYSLKSSWTVLDVLFLFSTWNYCIFIFNVFYLSL